jgi:type II secretory pathway component PulF
MQLYSIKFINEDGKSTRKLVEVELDDDIIPYVDALGANVLSVKKLPSFYRHFRLKKTIKKQEIIEIIDNLHLIVKAGLPVNTGLMDLAKDAENPQLNEILMDLSHRIQMGMSFSRAISKYEKIFSEVVVNLIRIGEETGQMDNTLKDAANHLKKINDLKSKTKSALIYPAFALVAMLGTMIFWLVFVMPKMINAFKSFNIELPPTTRFVMGMSDFMQNNLFSIIVFMVGFSFLNTTLRKTNDKYRYITDKLLTRLPVFGPIVRNFNFAFIAEYVRLMISAGLPLYSALTIMEESLTNSVYKRSIENSRELISVGKSFSDALSQQKMYPHIIIRMVSIGEQTGNLDTQLDNVARYYYEKVDYIATNISKMIEPIIIGFIGIFMFIIMLGLMGPIFSLISGMPT